MEKQVSRLQEILLRIPNQISALHLCRIRRGLRVHGNNERLIERFPRFLTGAGGELIFVQPEIRLKNW